jgi:hypothetical protein
MRHESCVTSLSWIPSEAIEGGTRLAFDAGFTRYDDPPPGELGELAELQQADRFRFANVLRAWVDVDESGRITGAGYGGGGLMGSTTIRLGGLRYRFQAVQLPDLQRELEQADGSGCPRPGGCSASLTSSGRPRWYGRPCRSPCTPTGVRNTR